MPRKKGWKKAEVKRGNRSAVLRNQCKYDNGLDRTEELASLKTENQDIRQVHELDVSKFANDLLNNLPNNLQNSSCTEIRNEEYGDITPRMSESIAEACFENEATVNTVFLTSSETSSTFAHTTGDVSNQNDTALSTFAEGNHDTTSVVSTDKTGISRFEYQCWNSYEMEFGSFHQNAKIFSAESRGFQCTGNALSMLAYAVTTESYCTSLLDKILCDGDQLYCTIINKLKCESKFVQPLLSLEEIPDTFNIGDCHFIVKKQPIISGILIETGFDTGLSTLYSALEKAFVDNSSGLLTTGAICSALFKKRETFFFFDSHSHGRNGLSICDGTSILIAFPSLEDTVAYLYAYYDSLSIDFNTQFDLLPLTIQLHDTADVLGDLSESLLAAYFKDQKVRQQTWQEKVPNNVSGQNKACKTKNRKLYHQMYKRKQRKSLAFKKKEQGQKLKSRKNPSVLAKECAQKQEYRNKPGVLAKECAQKQEYRKKTGVLAKEYAHKQECRKKPGVLAKELVQKQKYRQKPGVLAKELVQKQKSRQKPGVLAKELVQ
ncbi:MAG: hypothetical protein N0E59_14250, partial [Candidatus Thiodiazotropha taylori]|nr:hypothetical protein [Candidatus Thiodiazotropha taylori]MCW4284271.1 hypothetical protein [Candidatus Thiodiazotropha taylori]